MIQTKDLSTTNMNPCLVKVNNKTYICPGWIEVHNDTLLNNVLKHYKIYEPAGAAKPTKIKIDELVDSSSGKKQYKVSYDGMWWNCDCAGFGFRKKCHHVDEVKLKHSIL